MKYLYVFSLFSLASAALTVVFTGDKPQQQSHAAQALQAFQALGSEWDVFQDLYADNASITLCRAGSCIKGDVESIWKPVHNSLTKFYAKSKTLTGESDAVTSIEWYNYIETVNGCSQVTSGIAVFEFDENHKVIHHYSLSDDDIHCVPQHDEIGVSRSIH